MLITLIGTYANIPVNNVFSTQAVSTPIHLLVQRRQTGRQAGRRAGRQTGGDRQADRQVEKQTSKA